MHHSIEPAAEADPGVMTTEQSLRERVDKLRQLLVLAGIIVALQFGVMLTILLQNPR